MPVKLVADLIKLIFDPYSVAHKNEEIYTQRVQLTAEFLQEIRRIAGCVDYDEDGQLTSHSVNLAQTLFDRLCELTSDFISFRTNKNAIKVPSIMKLRTMIDA